MEEGSSSKLCMVPFLKWVKRGVAKKDPEKVQLSKEELQEIVASAKNKLPGAKKTRQDSGSSEDDDEDVDKEDDNENRNEDDEFNMDQYDAEDANHDMGIGSLTQLPTDGIENFNDDSDSDDEDDGIKPDDNLVLVTRIEGDTGLLEVYVYNEDEGSLYCHHDLLLPSLPLAVEWLDHEAGQSPGNYCALSNVGYTTIDVWDLDVVNSLEPAYTLGKDKEGHTGDILDLSWNSNFNHILASCDSDSGIILWDLDIGEPVTKFKEFAGHVTSLKWHHFEWQTLLAGGDDRTVKVFDCRDPSVFQSWQVNGRVEKICWNTLHPFSFMVGTADGLLAYFDCRMGMLWEMKKAHDDEVSGLAISSLCPGLVVTTGMEGNLKVWDVLQGEGNENSGECDSNVSVKLVYEKDLKLGTVYTMQVAPELPFTVAVGGNNKSHSFDVQNLMNVDVVKTHFGDRQLIKLMESDETVSAATQ